MHSRESGYSHKSLHKFSTKTLHRSANESSCRELLVFETTLATQSPAPGFSHAVDVAKRQLTDEDFLMAVDVRRSRMQKLRPLTVTAKTSVETHGEQAPKVSEALESAPELPTFDVDVKEEPATAADKLELWQRKLLDLNTRNRLLHLPESAKAIRLICPDPAGLEDILEANKSVRIVPMPDLEVGGRDSGIYEKRNHESLEEEASRQAMARNEVLSRMEKGKLDTALIDLYRKARSDLEEGGSNTLFLALVRDFGVEPIREVLEQEAPISTRSSLIGSPERTDSSDPVISFGSVSSNLQSATTTSSPIRSRGMDISYGWPRMTPSAGTFIASRSGRKTSASSRNSLLRKSSPPHGRSRAIALWLISQGLSEYAGSQLRPNSGSSQCLEQIQGPSKPCESCDALRLAGVIGGRVGESAINSRYMYSP